MTVWAFAGIEDEDAKAKVYESIKKGKNRFGWSQEDEDDLRREWNGQQAFLLSIQPGDWIVNINMPTYGQCVASKAIDHYNFDDGIECSWGKDFRHNIAIDVSSIIEFDRNSEEILPTVNLKPRQRYMRVHAKDDFLQSIENLKTNAVSSKKSKHESKEVFFLKEKTEDLLHKLTALIQENHKGKDLERYFAKVFSQMPDVVDVKENGFGWKSDNGADLIVTTSASVSNIQLENTIVVQIKSYTGEHCNLDAVEQIETAIKEFDAHAGMIITTATRTDELEEKIEEKAQEMGIPIELIAGEDVAKFVLKYDKDQNLLFNLNY